MTLDMCLKIAEKEILSAVNKLLGDEPCLRVNICEGIIKISLSTEKGIDVLILRQECVPNLDKQIDLEWSTPLNCSLSNV